MREASRFILFTTSVLNISQPNGFTFVVSLYHTITWIYQENLRTSPLNWAYEGQTGPYIRYETATWGINYYDHRGRSYWHRKILYTLYRVIGLQKSPSNQVQGDQHEPFIGYDEHTWPHNGHRKTPYALYGHRRG